MVNDRVWRRLAEETEIGPCRPNRGWDETFVRCSQINIRLFEAVTAIRCDPGIAVFPWRQLSRHRFHNGFVQRWRSNGITVETELRPL